MCGFVCALNVYACEKFLESISNSNPNPASWHDYAYLKKSFRRNEVRNESAVMDDDRAVNEEEPEPEETPNGITAE